MDKKKKIAIATRQMVMGGIEKSLIDLCKALLDKNCDVTLYLESLGGELYNNIPSGIEIVHIFKNHSNMYEIFKQSLQLRKPLSFISALASYFINFFGGDPVKSWISISKCLETVDIKYDYAFAYGAPVSFSVIFIDKIICANKKFAWIHNDVSKLTLDITKYNDIFETYDKIVCVSQKAKISFLEYLPKYESKTTVFYNIIDKANILKMANEHIIYDSFEGTKLLTVGRLSREKGHDLIPKIAEKLVNAGYNIRWYCVGDGEERKNLEKQIKDLKLESRVFILGSFQNPYPYYKMADIYVQPSRNEGFGITISEAKIFFLPIVTTDFDGANEQIDNGETGIIVHFDEDEIYQALVFLLDNKNIKERIKRNLINDKKRCESDLKELIN